MQQLRVSLDAISNHRQLQGPKQPLPPVGDVASVSSSRASMQTHTLEVTSKQLPAGKPAEPVERRDLAKASTATDLQVNCLPPALKSSCV